MIYCLKQKPNRKSVDIWADQTPQKFIEVNVRNDLKVIIFVASPTERYLPFTISVMKMEDQ